MNKVASYIGNLGKSVGFMAIDAVKGYTETGSEFVAQNSELFKEIYSGIKNYRQTVKRTGHLIKQSTVYDSGEKLIRNVFDDIRTGNLYNKQRIDKYEMEALGMDDFGVDVDIDMEAKEGSSGVEISAEDRRAARTNSVIEMASAEASSMIANTTAKTGQYIVSNMHASDQMRRVENTQLVHSLATGFGSVQAGIAKVLDFANGPLVTHMQNSAKYYENSIKLMQEQNAMFKEFLEMQREQYKVQLEQEKKNKLGYGDIVGANGTPDLKAYAKMIGGNAKNIMSEFGMDMLLGDGLGGKKGSMLNAMLANPIGALGTMAIKALIPQVLKNTAESFNESLQGLFGTIIGRFNRMAKGDGIGSYLGRLFGIRNNLKEDVSAGQFKKGPVPFDGITRNAIINVIPSHLRRIEAAITNKPERIFDSETGKWSTAKEINAKYEDKKKSFRDQAVGDTEKEMHDMIKKLGIMDRAEEQKLLKGMSDLLTNMYKTGGTFNFAKKGLDGSDYGIDDQELFDNLLAILNASSFKSGGKRGNKNLRQLDSRIINARTAQTKWAEDTSLDGASAYGLIASGDIDPRLLKEYEKRAKSSVNFNPLNPLSMKDKDGNSAYYYMRSILAELRVHREILSGVPKGRGKRQKTSITIAGKSYSLDDLSDSDVDRLVKSSAEKSEAQKEFDRKTQLDDRHREKTAKANKERGYTDLDELTATIIDSRVKDIKIREEMEEARDARSRDSSVIKAGRKAADNYEKRKKSAKDGKGSFMDQLIAAGSLGEKMKVIQEGISHIASKPAQMLQGVIESADTHLYNFFFGETDETDADGNPIRGFMGKMTKELQDTFSKFNDWLNNKLLKPMMEKLGLKTWEDVPRKIVDLFGGSGAYDRMKENAGKKIREGLQPYGQAIKSAFGTAKKDVVGAFGAVKNDYYEMRGIDPNAVAEEVKTNARGARYITKSGITTISQGEMIIPSELNPYNPYRLATNKAAEIANEEAIRSRFSNRLASLIKRRVHRNAEGDDPITASDTSAVIGADKATERIIDPNSAIGTLERGIGTVAHRLFGKEGQSKEQFDGMMKGMIGQIKSSAPEAVGKGVLGGTLGLLIGGPGAIMLGAAAGAATGIVKNSEGLQNLLFGKLNEETGEKEGGIISDKLQKNFTKYFPDMKNYGIVGGLTLFPFLGPIGGILAGSALGFAKNNDAFQNYLFGEVNPETGKRDLESGLIGGANKEKLKKAFPAIGAGALAGLFLGPFGIIGNAAMGAGVGMLSTTDKFKDVVLGKEDENGERKGGVLGAIRTGVIDPIKESLNGFKERVQEFIDEDILEPLKEFMEPFAQGAKNFFGSLLKTVGHGINKLFENSLGIPLDRLIKEKIIQPLTGFVGKTLKLLTAPLRTVVSAPFKFLGGIGNSIRKGQIKRGTADDMTADQRMKFRSRHRMGLKRDKYLEEDKILANWFKGENGENLVEGEDFDARVEDMRSLAQKASDAAYADEDFFLTRKRQLKTETSGKVSQWFEDNKRDTKKDRKRIRDKILRAINDGDIEKASAILNRGDFSRKESEELQAMINDFSKQHTIEDNKRMHVIGNGGAFDQIKQELAQRFGIKNIKDKDVARIARNLNSELKAKGLSKVKADVTEEGTGQISNLLSDDSERNPFISVLSKGFEKAIEAVNHNLEKENKKKDARAARNLAKIRGGNIGNDDFDFSEEFADWAGTKRSSQAVRILSRTRDGQQDSAMADRLMKAAKSGDKKAMKLLEHMSKNTDRFNLTADDIGRISALTGRKRRHTKKVLKTKGFNDMADFYAFKDLGKRDRKWVAKYGKSLKGTYSDDAANLDGMTSYNIAKGIETHALGGLVGKAWDATKAFGNNVKKRLGVLSAGEAGVDPKTKEGMDTLAKAKETQEENLEIAQENVEVDKEQTSVLKQISAQLKDVWKNQDLSLRTKITDTGKVIRIGMGKDGTPQAANDKSSVEAIKEEQEDRSIMRRLADGVSGFGEKIGNFLGFGKDEDDDKVSWFDKIKDAIVKGLGAITITAAAGHAYSAWEDKIKPWIEEKMQGWLSNPESPAYKIAAKLDNFYQMFYNWVTGANGSKWSLPGIIQNYGTWMQSGLQLFVERVIPKGVELVVSVLPDLVVGLVKGIKNGIGSLFSKWFKWGGYKEEENIINIPKIGSLNANSTPFQDALLGWAKTGQKTSLSTIVPKYNTTTGTQVKISSGGQISIESGMTADDKMSAIAGIVNQNNGPLDSGISFTRETIIGGYTFADLTSGKLSNDEIQAAVADFSTQHNLDATQQQSIIDILSQNTIQTSDYTVETIRSLIKQNANADYVQKRNTITTIMKLVKQNDKYYDTNGLDEEQTQEVYQIIANVLNDSKINTPDNKLYQIESQVNKYVSQIKKDYAFDTTMTGIGTATARGIVTGGIQNFRVGGLLKGTGKVAKHIPLPGFRTAGKVIEGSGKGVSKFSGKISSLGRGFSNFGDNIVLGMSEQVMDNIAKNPGKYLKGDDMMALAMNAGREAQIDATAKAAQHAAAHGFSEEATERIATKFGQNAAEKAVGETAQNLTASGLKESTEKISSRVAARTAQNAAEETVEGAAKGATKNSGLIAKFCNWVGKKIGELFGNSKVVGWIKNSKIGKKMAGKSIEEVMQAAAKKIGATIAKILPERIAKAGTSALAKITSVFGTGGTITIAFAVADFISGCTNAESIMGVTKDQEISWGQRLCAGLVKCVNGFVTLGFVPESVLYDLFIDILGPALGFDTSSLQEMRDEAQAQLDEYNLEHGTNLTMEEYNKKNSWWGKTKDKIGEVAGKAWDKTKEGAKWLGGKVADGAKWVGGKVKDFAVGVKDLAVKAGTAVATKAKEIGTAALDIGTFIKDVTTNVIKVALDPEYSWDIDNYIKEDDPLGGAKKTIYQALKIPLGIIGVVTKAGKFVYDKVKGFVLDIKDGAGDAFTDIANVAKGQYTIFSGDYWKFNDSEDSENPLGIISKISSVMLKVMGMGPAMIGWTGSKLWEGIKKLVSGAKEGFMDAKDDVANVIKGQYTIFNGEYWKTNVEEGENPLSMLGNIFGFIQRVISAPSAMLGWTGTKLWEGFKALISGAKEGSMDASQDVSNVMKGQYTIFSGEYWKANNTDEENPMSTLGSIFGFIQRVLNAPKAMLGWTGTKIWQGIKALISGAKEGLMDASADVAAVSSGQYTIFSGDYWKSNQDDPNNPLSTVGNIFGFVSRLFSAPGAMMGWVGNKVVTWFRNTVANAKAGMTDASADVAAVSSGQYTIFSSEYWKSNQDDGNPLSAIGNVAGFATRLFQAPSAMVGWVATKVKNVFTKIIDGAKDVQSDTDKIIEKAKKGNISVFSKDYWSVSEVKDNPLGMVGTIASFIQRLAEAPIVIFEKVFNKIKEKFDSIKGWFAKLFGEDAEEVDTADGKGRPRNRRRARFGKGRYSQLDPSISNMEYNGNTIGEAGCGPVAAANIINNIRGSHMSVEDAANYATTMGFKQKGDGTDPRYFNSILSASGIDNQNISGRSSIKQNLANGNPVIIMGQGNSDQSPYGKYNPHYITAMGYDSRGNVIVDDPYESDYTTYKESDIMNGIMKSTAVGRNGFGRGRFGFGRFGMGKLSDTQLNALTKKAFVITNGAEGDYTTVIPNDNGSWSVGIAGFHGSAKIKPLFEAMAAKLSGTAKTQALKFAGWGSKILSSSEAAEVKAFLEANSAVSKEVQDKHLTEHIQSANFATAIKMYEAGELLDPRSIVLIGDIANTGPAHVDTWRKVHTKASSAATDLENTKNSLMTKSYWANPPAKNAKYKQGWLNRISNTYNILKNWDGVTVDNTGSSSDSGSSNSGVTTLFTAISDLGTSMVKNIYGEDVYEAIFGSQAAAASGDTSGSSDGSTNTSEVKKLDGTTVSGPVSSNEHIKKAQIAIANKMYSREGKNSYSQNGSLREKQGTSNSDCSSMVSWAYRQALGSDSLTNQLMGSTLPGWSGYTGSQWGKGTLIDTNKNSSKFQVGDLLFWGSGGKTAHVEMYTGQDTIMGHGSGIGPREKKLSTYQHSKAFMGGRRYLTEDIAKQAGYGKGRRGFGSTIAATRNNDIQGAKVVNLRPSYGATTQAVAIGSKSGGSVPTGGRTVSSNYVELLKIVIEALYKVAGNTEKISMIYDILAQKLGVDTSDTANKLEAKKTKVDNAIKKLEAHSTFDGNTPEVSDADVEAILQMMTAIARE